MCSPKIESSNGYEKIEVYDEFATSELSKNYASILKLIGEDPNREGLDKTPERVAKAMQFLLQGYKTDPVEILQSAMFKEDYRQMVIVKDIEIYSMCEHHLLPFFGKAHVAYVSSGQVIGLSKINRIVDYFARRPQVQERLTVQIAAELKRILKTEDVAVVIDAKHLCVSSRGIQDEGSSTITAEYGGIFKEQLRKEEFLKYLSLNV